MPSLLAATSSGVRRKYLRYCCQKRPSSIRPRMDSPAMRPSARRRSWSSTTTKRQGCELKCDGARAANSRIARLCSGSIGRSAKAPLVVWRFRIASERSMLTSGVGSWGLGVGSTLTNPQLPTPNPALRAIRYPNILHLRGVAQEDRARARIGVQPVVLLAIADPGLLQIADRATLDHGAALAAAEVPRRVNIVMLGQHLRQRITRAGDDIDHATGQ